MIAEIFEIFLILDFFKKNVNNVLGRVYFYQYYSFTACSISSNGLFLSIFNAWFFPNKFGIVGRYDQNVRIP